MGKHQMGWALGEAGDPGGQVMEKPMEKLVKHAFLPSVRNKAGERGAG